MPALFWRISQPAFQVWLGRSEPEWSNCLVDATQSEHTLTHVLLNDDLRCSVCHECIYWEPVSHGISTSLKFWAHGNHRLGPRKPKGIFFRNSRLFVGRYDWTTSSHGRGDMFRMCKENESCGSEKAADLRRGASLVNLCISAETCRWARGFD